MLVVELLLFETLLAQSNNEGKKKKLLLNTFIF